MNKYTVVGVYTDTMQPYVTHVTTASVKSAKATAQKQCNEDNGSIMPLQILVVFAGHLDDRSF